MTDPDLTPAIEAVEKAIKKTLPYVFPGERANTAKKIVEALGIEAIEVQSTFLTGESFWVYRLKALEETKP